MKKLLYLALVVATAFGFTSCEEKENERPQDDSDIYVGTLVVTNMTDESSYTKENTKFEFNDDTNTLTMWGVAFSESMPVSVDIVIANVPEISDDIYNIDSITATLQDGSPAPSFISDLTNVAIVESNDTIGVTFNVDVTMAGATTTYAVAYAGIEIE